MTSRDETLIAVIEQTMMPDGFYSDVRVGDYETMDAAQKAAADHVRANPDADVVIAVDGDAFMDIVCHVRLHDGKVIISSK